jgi:mRNA interferase YafQ
MYIPVTTTKFDKDLKKCQNRGKDLLKIKLIMEMLINGETLPLKNRDHNLVR